MSVRSSVTAGHMDDSCDISDASRGQGVSFLRATKVHAGRAAQVRVDTDMQYALHMRTCVRACTHIYSARNAHTKGGASN